MLAGSSKKFSGFFGRGLASGLAGLVALGCAMCIASWPASAGGMARDMTVSARVIRNCDLATPSSSANPGGNLAAERMSATITVNCGKSGPAAFALSWSGETGKSTIATRAVGGGGGYLGYVIYGDSGNKSVWNAVDETASAPSQFRWVLFVY